jgi:4-amino-4-deoxy-L-arabinose transferase-like glycosyltransferase
MQLTPRSEDSTERERALVFVGLMVLALVVSLLLISDKLFFVFGFDTPNYILLAKSIATGHGYSDINTPGFPPHTQYPPGLPLILSPVLYLFGYNLVWMHLAVIFFAFLSIYVIKRVFESVELGYLGIFIALLTLTSFHFVEFSREILSEVPYLFFSLLGVLFFEKYFERRENPLYLVLFTAALVAAYFVKMIGITLYAAALTALALRALEGRGRARLPIRTILVFAVLAILPFVLFMLRNAYYSSGVDTYQSIFLTADYYNLSSGHAGLMSIFSRTLQNLGIYAFLPSKMVLTYLYGGGFPAWAGTLISLLLLVLMLYGLGRELYRKRGIKEFYVIYFFGLIIAWPVYGLGDSYRYLVPLIPFFYYYLFMGIGGIAGRVARSSEGAQGAAGRRAVALCFALLLVLNVMAERPFFFSSTVPSRIHYSVSLLGDNLFKRYETLAPEAFSGSEMAEMPSCFRHYVLGSYYLRTILRPGDVVTSRKPWLTALITGGYVLKFPFTPEREKMLEFFRDKKVDYVLVDGCYRETRDYVFPFMQKYSGLFERPHKKYLVFRFRGVENKQGQEEGGGATRER